MRARCGPLLVSAQAAATLARPPVAHVARRSVSEAHRLPMNGQAQIVVEGVTHTYRSPRGRPVQALADVSLEVRGREFFALLGPSGCGKSTLLYLIGGFFPTEAGRILIDSKPVTSPGPDRGIVFQHFALFPWKTVRANILYGLERQGLPRPERQQRAQAFIDLVGL